MREKASLEVVRRMGAGRGVALGVGAGFSMGFSIGFSIGFSKSFSAGLSKDLLNVFSGDFANGDVLIGGGELGPGLWLSKRAAREAVRLVVGRTVPCVDEEILRVGEGLVGDFGGSAAVAAPRVFSQVGGLLGSAVPVDRGRAGLVGVGVISFGFNGELVGVASCVALRGEVLGVVGRRVEGECVSGVLGRRNGEVRELLKESGDGLYGVGVED